MLRDNGYSLQVLSPALEFELPGPSVPFPLAKGPQIYITGKNTVGISQPVGALDPGLEPLRRSPLVSSAPNFGAQ